MVSRKAAARQSPDVNLSTVEEIKGILERAERPVSRNGILAELEDRGRSTTRPRLNRVLRHFFDLKLAAEGSKGIQWTHNLSPSLLQALTEGNEV